jgi:hypothetical protein
VWPAGGEVVLAHTRYRGAVTIMIDDFVYEHSTSHGWRVGVVMFVKIKMIYEFRHPISKHRIGCGWR